MDQILTEVIEDIDDVELFGLPLPYAWPRISEDWSVFLERMGRKWWGDVPSDRVTSILSTSPEGTMIVCGPSDSDPKGTLCATYTRNQSDVTRSLVCMDDRNLYFYKTEEGAEDMYRMHVLISKVNDLVRTARGTLLSSEESANECLTDVMVRELDNLKTYLTERNLLWGRIDVKGSSNEMKCRRTILREYFQDQAKIRKRVYGIVARMEYEPDNGYVFDVFTRPKRTPLIVSISPAGFVVSKGRLYKTKACVYKTALELVKEIGDTHGVALLRKDKSVLDAFDALVGFAEFELCY